MRTSFQIKMLSGAAISAVFLTPYIAHAQVNQTDDDVVVATGFRQSLEAGLDVKRGASGVVDAIVAEDIASFPDLNLAESLQRIPGVSINRVAGEGRNITVRGLGADFTRVRLNGMEAINTTGASDASGGANRGRGFDFNTFASDLFNELRVTKTSSASIEEGSLGATVDLKTAQPFDYASGFNAAASAQAEYNDLSENVSPRFAGLMSYSNENKTFGALVSLAYSDREIREEGFSSVRWQDGNFRSVDGVACPAGAGCDAIDTNSLVYHPRIPRYGRLTHDQQRIGLTGALQFAPTEKTTISLDGLYSNFEGTRNEQFLEVFFRSQEGRIDVINPTINTSNNTLDSGTFNISPVGNGTHPVRSEGRYDELNTDFTQLTLNVEHEFSDRLSGNFLAGAVRSEFDNPKQTTILFDAVDEVTGYSYDFRGNENTPAIDFGSLDVTDPTQFAFTEFRDRPQNVDNSFDMISADVTYDLNDTVSLNAGLSHKAFEFDTLEVRRESTNGSLVCGVATCDAGAPGLSTAGLLDNVTGFGSGLNQPSGNVTSWIAPDPLAAANLIGAYNIPGTVRSGNDRTVEEKDTGFFVQADFTADLGNIPVRGDIGVRYVKTEVTSTGLVNGTDVTVDRSYDDTLPALNLTFDLQEDLLLRLGAAKVMARPSLGNLTPGGSLDSFNGPPFRYNAGNPSLNPFRATTFDASLEYYFADEALISLSGFHKDVSSFFLQGDLNEVAYSQSGLPASLAPASSPLAVALAGGGDPLVETSQQVNGGGAKLSGLEFAYQQPFSFLPGKLSNTGFQGNYTYVDSSKILGFSPNAFNATVYYEDDRFSARISTAYRDAYKTRNSNSAGRDERGVSSSTNVDFASSYKLTDQIDITFEGINLTDEFENQVFDAGDLVNVYHHTGRSFLLGARWKM